MVKQAYFQDVYRAPLTQSDASVTDIFFAIFGHRPVWMNGALAIRNRGSTLCGLDGVQREPLER